jgi:putative chitinase
MNITQTQLGRIFPRTATMRIAQFVEPLNQCFMKWGIDSPKQAAWFLGIYGHECAELNALEENLNYSAQGLADTWPARYARKGPDGKYIRRMVKGKLRNSPNDTANRLGGNAIAVANNVYASRIGNGPESSGDGWRFRGAGMPQLTGRANFAEYSAETGVDALNNPALLRNPEGAADPAGWYWHKHELNDYVARDDFDGACDVVNMGRKTERVGDALGYEERKAIMQRALEVLT